MVVAALVIGAAVWHRPLLLASGLWTDGGQPTVSPTFFDAPSASPEPAGSGVIGQAPAAAQGKAPTPAGLTKAIAAVPAKGLGTTSGVVVDVASGRVLWQRNQNTPLVPASTMKLLTSVAALNLLGPDTTFTTRVVATAPGKLVLVGGGDPYLASVRSKDYPNAPSSAELAQRTAAALKQQGTRTVSLGYDESLFTGPAWHPSWPDGYHDQVTTVSALWIDQGRPAKGQPASRTPALSAAQLFAKQLKANGITVAGSQTAVRPGAEATEVAAIDSLPVRTLVQETLVHSDNSAAEVLLRQAGLKAGAGGSFAGGTKAVQQQLATLKAWTPQTRLVDGSGLSRANHVPAVALAVALRAAATQDRLAAAVEGLPSAGVTGTLHSRFYTDQARPGRGWVNAKTGTLTKVATLAGQTRTRSGEDVVFALMANNQTEEWGARTWLDQVAATIASCGC
ncbi:D-alanyl-D-alanine carboxypeptidase/D-alanyl-D-alanine-endopeptidase [Luteococcus peritonei]